MKFYNLRSAEQAILLGKFSCKVNKDLRRVATLELSIRLKSSMCSDLPGGFKNSLELMKQDSNIEKIELESEFDGLRAKIFNLPDSVRPKMAILAVTCSDFDLHRAKQESTRIRLGWKMTFDFTEDHESATWMLENLGNEFFWELEALQPELIDANPKEDDKGKAKKGAKKVTEEAAKVTEAAQ